MKRRSQSRVLLGLLVFTLIAILFIVCQLVAHYRGHQGPSASSGFWGSPADILQDITSERLPSKSTRGSETKHLDIRKGILYVSDDERGRQQATSLAERYGFVQEIDFLQFENSKRNPPTIIESVTPKYPRDLVEEGISGKAWVVCIVDEEGRISEAAVKEATDSRFGDSALDAIRKSRFRPADYLGREMMSTVSIPYSFKLKKSESEQ